MLFSVGALLRDPIARRPLTDSFTDTFNPSGTSTVAIGRAGFPAPSSSEQRFAGLVHGPNPRLEAF